jgi:hypothetical protein
VSSFLQKIRQHRFWFSTFGTAIGSIVLAFLLKNNLLWYGVGWIVIWIFLVALIVFPGRYDVAALEAALGAFFSAMEFPASVHIRCAIYVPIKKGSKLEQITNYIPDGKSGKGHRLDSRAGIVGRAFRENKHWLENLNDEKFSSSEYFLNDMVSRWGFTHEEARKLTQDRRSYSALVIKDESKVIIGILYSDSNSIEAFKTPEAFERAQKFVPFFTQLLKLRGSK